MSIFRASSRWPCEELALVLKAMSIEHRVTEQPDGCHLLVPADSAGRATEQLGLYRRENPRRLATPWPPVAPSRGAGAAMCWALALLLLYQVQAHYLGGVDWLETGQLVAGRIRDGEWWLGVTALMLHADAAHVAGNMAFGAFFVYLAAQYLGPGVAWLAIVWLAAAGNIANAFLQSDWHRSVGASTAVLAALGLVASFVWGIARHHYLGWARRWAPLVGAVALLAYIGTGDERTDIVAHLAGFLAGVGGGFLLYWAIGPRPATQAAQTGAGVVALVTVVLCWYLALSNR